ncbi:MAG: hypothetical protein CMJ32_10155 [Phycisphaerae bacterium]|nr:hypothetical protein [Phycisphaerae bacterium]
MSRPCRTSVRTCQSDVAAVPGRDLALLSSIVGDDETVLLAVRPSPWYIVLSSLALLLLILVLTLGLAWMARLPWFPWSDHQAFALGVMVGFFVLAWRSFDWFNRMYVLTDRRVICRRGVIRVILFEAPLKNIQHTSIVVMVRERILGLGTIGFATSGTGIFDTWWESVREPFKVHSIVLEAIERYGR